jgi:hypothetical protein
MRGGFFERSGRFARCVAAGALAGGCLLVLPPTALAQDPVNTFEGSCSNIPATAFWVKPQTFVPEENHWIIFLDGGSCDGTVNGQPIHGLPQRGRVDMYGPQSCAGGLLHGRSHTQVDGKDFYTSVQERRLTRDGYLTAEGDAGGLMLLHGHGRVGLIKDSDPLAKNPVLKPFAEPMDIFEFMDACTGPGLTTAKTQIDQAVTAPSTSSPAHEEGATSDPFSPAPDSPPPSSGPVPPV